MNLTKKEIEICESMVISHPKKINYSTTLGSDSAVINFYAMSMKKNKAFFETMSKERMLSICYQVMQRKSNEEVLKQKCIKMIKTILN